MKSLGQAVRMVREAITNQPEGADSSEDDDDPRARPVPTDSAAAAQVRQRVASLVAAQANVSPLQLVENLARGNRQIAALAAIVAAQAGREVVRTGPQVMRRASAANELPHGFVQTGIKSLVRRRDCGAFSEPDFKILERRQARGRSGASTSAMQNAAPAPERLSKTEVLVTTLMAACERANIAPGEVPSVGLLQDMVDVEHQADFLHQAPLADSLGTLCRLIGMGRHAPGACAPSLVGGDSAAPLSHTDLTQLLDDLNVKTHDELILLLAKRSSEMAVFFSFIDHALVIGNVNKEGRIERYEYEEDFGRLADQLYDTGEPWFDTFLEGVQRNTDTDTTTAFRMRVGDQWHQPESKTELLNHIFLNALDHLRAEQPRAPAMPIYPLIAYELIGDAVGVPVPAYLAQHEAAILEELHNNEVARSARSKLQQEQLAQAHLERDQAQAAMAQRMRENHVKSIVQLHFCMRGYDWQKVVADSADHLLPLSPLAGSTHDLQASIQAQLAHTHDRQEVSYVSHSRQGRDNLCWLRSGWISVFASATPDYLASRLTTLCTPDMHAARNAPILGTIASQFRSNPVAFMHGERSLWKSIAESLSQPARLGPANGAEFRTREGVSLPRSSIEAYLQDLQQNLAAAFRFENTSIMNEVESLLMPGTFASSDMTVALHRAFNLPALIIESGSQVNAAGGADLSLQFRLACPRQGPLAEILEASGAAGDDASIDNAGKALDLFRDSPIIWLEREHYDVYLPKSAIEGGTATV